MRGVCQSEPKFLAVFTSMDASCFSPRTEIPGGISQFGRGAFFGQNRNAWRYLPVWMRGFSRPGPKSQAVFANSHARRLSVGNQVPGDISQCACEAFFGQGQNSWRYFLVWMRDVCRSEPELLATFPSLNARCLSVRTKTPGDISQFGRSVVFSQNRNSWRRFPVHMWGVIQSEPGFLAAFPNLNAGCLSVRTQCPGNTYQFKCGAFFSQDPLSWRYFSIRNPGGFRSEPKFLAIHPSLNARCYSARANIFLTIFSSFGARCLSVRTKTPGETYESKCEARFGQNRNSLQ